MDTPSSAIIPKASFQVHSLTVLFASDIVGVRLLLFMFEVLEVFRSPPLARPTFARSLAGLREVRGYRCPVALSCTLCAT